MELRDVESFLEVARELHFGRAAQRLGLTQGRVSQIISGLEQEVGGKLFDRSSRTVRLTPLGEQFRDGSLGGYNALAEVLRSCQAAARRVTNRIRLGYLPPVGTDFILDVVRTFETRHPDHEVMVNALVCHDLPDFLAEFTSWNVDVALVLSPAMDDLVHRFTDLIFGPVLTLVPRGVLMPHKHPLAQHQTVCIEDLADYELLRFPDTADTSIQDKWTPKSTPSGRPLTYTAQDICQMTGRSEFIPSDVAALVVREYGLHLTMITIRDHCPFSELVIVPVRDMPSAPVIPVWSADTENAAIRVLVESAAYSHSALTGSAIARSATADMRITRCPRARSRS